jgi:3-hydroxyisobutyrate dehydrogenase
MLTKRMKMSTILKRADTGAHSEVSMTREAQSDTVGFIGVGAMGQPMALNVLAVGTPVIVFDIDERRTSALADQGAQVAASPQEVAQKARIVVVMVATPAQLQSALFDERGAASALEAGHVLVIASSVGIAAAKAVETALAGRGVHIVDAPVTGGVARATTGELTILAGGAPEAIAAARDVLEAMSGRIAVCGASVGDGQAVKVVNQLLCSVHLAAAAEALALASALGLDPAAVLAAVETGAAGSFMLSDRGPRMLADTEPPVLSAIDIFVKDTSLVVAAAHETGAALPLAELTATRFADAQRLGWGRRDDSAIIHLYESAPRSSEEYAS